MTTQLAERLSTSAAVQQAGRGTANTVLGWLNSEGTQRDLVKALPRGMDPARFARIIQTEVRKNPALLEADQSSFMLAVINLAQLGLEPGPLGMAYLTGPFRNSRTGKKEVVPIIGYKGLKELAYRAGTVDFIDAVPVHEGEPFRIRRGTDPGIDHEELPECAENPVVAYYAFAIPKNGGRPPFEVMWPKDIEAIRKRSKAGSRDDSPWNTDFEAMALKTVTRRLCNRGKIRLSPEVQGAIAEDEARELGFDKPAFEITAPAIEATATEVTDEKKEQRQQDAAEAGKAAASAADTGEVEDPSSDSEEFAELVQLLEDVPEGKRWSPAVFKGKLERLGYERCRVEIVALRRQAGVEPADPTEDGGEPEPGDLFQ